MKKTYLPPLCEFCQMDNADDLLMASNTAYGWNCPTKVSTKILISGTTRTPRTMTGVSNIDHSFNQFNSFKPLTL